MKSDNWFYRIFRDFPALFFRLMRLPENQAGEYRFNGSAQAESSAVYLEELPEYPHASLEVAVLKLAVTSRDCLLDKARDLAAVAKSAETNVQDPHKVLALIEAFVISNFPQLTPKEIQAMLQLHDIRESTIFQDGLREGRQEGRQEGKVEEKMAIVAHLHSKGRSIKEICDMLDIDDAFVKKALATPQQDA